ncbi:unnamed protein product [Medioppia subpectinata]|uniref:LIM zinc-binding domain-containing protein n=1 Tax=Medioppia subpectinata TaxID=1979941 RepID=A0A7R9PUA7_9ACAR|nr:unnamed protein product [Medioppia subpectinata]CAG2101012.1 unnamed protein product [Medioppia subpectinata]
MDDKHSDDSMNEDDDKRMNNNHNNNNNIINTNHKFSYNNTHNREDSDDSSIVEITKNCQQIHNKSNKFFDGQQNDNINSINNDKKPINDINKSRDIDDNSEQNQRTDKIKVEIKDWQQQNGQQNKDNVLMYLLNQQQQQQQPTHNQNQQFIDKDIDVYNNSYDAEDDDEDDEELERIERLEQEKSFKAKLSAFENLAKSEETTHQISVSTKNTKSRDEPKREPQPQPREDMLHNKPQIQSSSERPVVLSGQRGQYENEDEDEEEVNARIQQLHRERQRAQRPPPVSEINGQQYNQSPSLGQNVIYQSPNYNQKPVQQSSQSSQQQYEQQQYYLMDEPIGKQNTIPIKSPNPVRPQPSQPTQQVHQKQPQLPYKQPIQATLPQEHLYVNQKQLFNNQIANHNHYEPIESRGQRFGPSEREYYDSSQHMSLTTQQLSQMSTSDVGVQQQPQQQQQQQQQHQQQSQMSQIVSPDQTYPSPPHNQYLYYPKPYANNKPTNSGPVIQKPVMVSQQHKQPVNPRAGQPLTAKPQLKQQQSGYNQNHWLLQEAELRRQLDSIPTQASITPSTVSATQRTTTSTPSSTHKSSSSPQKGMLSVSGKKKCSSCSDELGRGCAAMVVESLSLYYHINCFRCSVCNIQLGNGTVGTDVRVRNHKLHCQNCYSNDEAGLKFSRV